MTPQNQTHHTRENSLAPQIETAIIRNRDMTILQTRIAQWVLTHHTNTQTTDQERLITTEIKETETDPAFGFPEKK